MGERYGRLCTCQREHAAMTPTFRLLDFRDHRAADQLERGRAIAQEQADQRLTLEYQRRVRANIAMRRQRDPRYLGGLFR
jgi:hypothetical protein